jgi:capsular polysaccharide transport system permease protein
MSVHDVKRREAVEIVDLGSRLPAASPGQVVPGEVVHGRAAPARPSAPGPLAVLNPMHWVRLARAPVPEGRAPNPLVRLAKGFTTFVILPTAVVGLYLFLIAADQYVVEARFAVRGITEPLANPNGMVSMIQISGTSGNNNQDGLIVTSYIDSLPLVREADKALDLRAMFSRGEADFLTRMSPDVTPEDLLKYWRKRVITRVDAISGIITLEVRTFDPADGVRLANFVLKRAEDLVNEISRRAREDAIARNREEADKAERRLKAAHLAMQDFRNRWGIIDPAKTAEAALQTVVGLRREKLKLENDLQVLRATLDDRSRTVQTIVATLQAVDRQIAEQQAQLTSEGATKSTNTTQAILEYEGYVIERTIAEKIHESTQGMLDRARVMAEKQQIFLTTFVAPSLPEDSAYPKRGWAMFTAFFSFLVMWSIGALLQAGVRDHRI